KTVRPERKRRRKISHRPGTDPCARTSKEYKRVHDPACRAVRSGSAWRIRSAGCRGGGGSVTGAGRGRGIGRCPRCPRVKPAKATPLRVGASSASLWKRSEAALV